MAQPDAGLRGSPRQHRLRPRCIVETYARIGWERYRLEAQPLQRPFDVQIRRPHLALELRSSQELVGYPSLSPQTLIPAQTYHRAQAQLDVEERRGEWPQQSWAASVLTCQAILRR